MSKDPAGIALSTSESYQVLLLGFHRVFCLCLLRCLGEVPPNFLSFKYSKMVFYTEGLGENGEVMSEIGEEKSETHFGLHSGGELPDCTEQAADIAALVKLY